MCCRSFVCRQTEEEEASGAKNEKRTKGGKKSCFVYPSTPFDDDRKKAKDSISLPDGDLHNLPFLLLPF